MTTAAPRPYHDYNDAHWFSDNKEREYRVRPAEPDEIPSWPELRSKQLFVSLVHRANGGYYEIQPFVLDAPHAVSLNSWPEGAIERLWLMTDGGVLAAPWEVEKILKGFHLSGDGHGIH